MRHFIWISLLLTACTAAQLNQAITEANQALNSSQPLTSTDVSNGLKEALVNGITKGTRLSSQVDGYFKNPLIKIPFPPDAIKAETRLREMGLGDQVDKFVLTLNRGAEEAAKDATPIFVEAIQAMTFDDAWGILKGSNDAATQYLKTHTSQQLKQKFTPVIQNALNNVSATKYYGDLVNTYNKIPLVNKVNPDLTSYATDMAIQGLFTMIANEEKNIRQDPVARTSDLLKRVFGAKQ